MGVVGVLSVEAEGFKPLREAGDIREAVLLLLLLAAALDFLKEGIVVVAVAVEFAVAVLSLEPVVETSFCRCSSLTVRGERFRFKCEAADDDFDAFGVVEEVEFSFVSVLEIAWEGKGRFWLSKVLSLHMEKA